MLTSEIPFISMVYTTPSLKVLLNLKSKTVVSKDIKKELIAPYFRSTVNFKPLKV